MSEKMRAARYYEAGRPMIVEEVDRPTLRSGDVLIKVEACGVVPNFPNGIEPPPPLERPKRPAIYGLDAAGVVVETGSAVRGVEIGSRVYVNPARYCLNCTACRSGRVMACEYMALVGYFGSGTKSAAMLEDYPYGGFGEYLTAPPYSLVYLPDNLSFEHAARWGYLGTGYAALRRGAADSRSTVLINGASGTLGLGAVLFGLAIGVSKILGVGRDRARLEEVKALAPGRIEVHSTLDDGPSISEWARSLTHGRGADVVIDALPTFSPVEDFVAAAAALARGGRHVDVGGVIGEIPINMFNAMNDDQTYAGSMWFTPEQGQEMADLVGGGVLDLGVLENATYGLDQVDKAIEHAVSGGRGGFANVVVLPPT